MDQPKLERLLRVMKMLTANNSLTVDEIAEQLSISPRSVYRYIDTFREAGFVIKKKKTALNSTNHRPISKTSVICSISAPKRHTFSKRQLRASMRTTCSSKTSKRNFTPSITTTYWPKPL